MCTACSRRLVLTAALKTEHTVPCKSCFFMSAIDNIIPISIALKKRSHSTLPRVLLCSACSFQDVWNLFFASTIDNNTCFYSLEKRSHSTLPRVLFFTACSFWDMWKLFFVLAIDKIIPVIIALKMVSLDHLQHYWLLLKDKFFL